MKLNSYIYFTKLLSHIYGNLILITGNSKNDKRFGIYVHCTRYTKWIHLLIYNAGFEVNIIPPTLLISLQFQ